MRVAALILTLGALGACTTMGISPARAEYERLAAACEARGGVLIPTGATTGRVETENACRISGAASRIGP